MGIWFNGIKETVKDAVSFTVGWIKSAIVLVIILLLIWAIVEIYNSIFGV